MQPPISFEKGDLWSVLPTQTPDLSSSSLASVNFKRSDPQRSPKLVQNQTRYKTEICRSFEENGCCRYGDKCQFAHGQDEVRLTNRHPKYKTQMCRTFHSYGFCPYGPRCHFIHNEDAVSLEIARGLNPQSPTNSQTPPESPPSSSPTFFTDEDPYPSCELFSNLSLTFPNFPATSAASSAIPRHRRLPVFGLLSTTGKNAF